MDTPDVTPLAAAEPRVRARAFRRFVQHRAAALGVLALVALAGGAVLGPWAGRRWGLDPTTQRIRDRYLPCGAHTTPPTAELEVVFERWLKADSGRTAATAAALRAAGLAPSPAPPDDEELVWRFWESLPAPAARARVQASREPLLQEVLGMHDDRPRRHPLGTDELGRDVLMRLCTGARVSLGIGLLAALVSGLIGLLVGGLGGYFGGLADTVLMRLTDGLLALPMIPVLILIAALDWGKVPLVGGWLALADADVAGPARVVFILALFSWMEIARVVRGSVLTIKQLEYLQAARALGLGHWRILRAHVLPNVQAPFLVAVTLVAGHAILAESALSFLGLGVQPPSTSWGAMLNHAQTLLTDAPRLAVLPGLLIFLTVISVNFVGDGLRDAVDPRTNA